MKEIGRISADIVTPKCLKLSPWLSPKLSHKDEKRGVVPELSPVKTIWLGQVEPEQDKKKNPGKPEPLPVKRTVK